MFTIRADQMAKVDRAVRLSFGQSVVAAVREDFPHVIQGLSEAEIGWRLESAVDHADRYAIRIARDFRSFVRLCFLVGPNFSTYPPFCDLLSPKHGAVSELFDIAEPEDWDRVAILEIVGRYGDLRARNGAEQLRTPVISIVPMTVEHADAVYRHSLHPDVWRLANITPALTSESARAEIEKDELTGDRQRFAILDAERDLAGALALERRDDGAELSYWIRRDRWGWGIATRAISELLSPGEAYSTMIGSHVTAAVDAGNLPSVRVLEKAGFVEEPGAALTGARHFAYRRRTS